MLPLHPDRPTPGGRATTRRFLLEFALRGLGHAIRLP